MASTVRKQVHGSLFTHSETPSHGMVPPIFRVGLVLQLNLSGNIPTGTPRGVFLWLFYLQPRMKINTYSYYTTSQVRTWGPNV